MSKQDNLATMQRLGEAVKSGNLDAFHEVFAPSVIDRDPASDQGSEPEGFIHFFTGFRAAFPDLNVSVEQLVAVEEVSDRQIRDQFETNFFGLLHVTRAVIPTFKKQGFGHILNLSSAGGRITLPLLGIYHASKFAVEGLSETNGDVHTSQVMAIEQRADQGNDSLERFKFIPL